MGRTQALFDHTDDRPSLGTGGLPVEGIVDLMILGPGTGTTGPMPGAGQAPAISGATELLAVMEISTSVACWADQTQVWQPNQLWT